MSLPLVLAEQDPLRLAMDYVERILPHRGRALLINQGVFIDKQRRGAKTIRRVTLDDCDGHFPGYPVFPGVQYLEIIAQVLGVLAGSVYDLSGSGYLASFDGISFRSKTHPGDEFIAAAVLDNTSPTRILGHGGVYRTDGATVVLIKKVLLLVQPTARFDPRPGPR